MFGSPSPWRWRKLKNLLRRNNLTVSIGASALAIFGFLAFSGITFYNAIGFGDERLTKDALRSELYDFLLITGREADGTSILDNPVDFSAMRRAPSVVALRKSFFNYPLTRANARTFRAPNVRFDLPRGCLLEFPFETTGANTVSGPGVQSLQICLAMVPSDAAGNYIYFALRYPSNGAAPHRAGTPLAGDGFELQLRREGRPEKRIRVVYENLPGLTPTRSLPGRYDGVFNVVGFPDESGRPTPLIGGQAIERVEDGDSFLTMTVLGRIDGNLLGLPSGPGSSGEFEAAARILRAGITVWRGKEAPRVISPTDKGVAKASLEQAYRTSVRQDARLKIEVKRGGIGSQWWSSADANPRELQEGMSRIQQFGEQLLTWLSRWLGSNQRPVVSKEISIWGVEGAVAELSLREVRVPGLAALAIGFVVAAFLGLLLLVALLYRSFARLTRLTAGAYSIGRAQPADWQGRGLGRAKARARGVERRDLEDQVGTLWRALSILLEREVRRFRRRRSEVDRYAQELRRSMDALRWVGHRIRNPLQALINIEGMPTEARSRMALLQRAFEAFDKMRSIEDDMEHLVALPVDFAQGVSGYCRAQNSDSNPIAYSGPRSGVFVVFDEIALQEILDILLENARRHMVPWSVIRVSLAIESLQPEMRQQVIIRVFNEGSAFITPTKVFDCGFTEGDHDGQGLGLYQLKRYVTHFGGEALAENPEGGAAIIITLPSNLIDS